jgi:arsenate reductase
MAEAFLNGLGADLFLAKSAGLEPGKLNPIVVEVMHEAGFDLAQASTKSVFDIVKSGEMFAYVITVCDEASAERCPIFVGVTQRLHWSFVDPGAIQGTHEEKLAGTREIRDAIRRRVEEWITQMRRAAPGGAARTT